MSKMGQLAMELDEQAWDMGYEDCIDALNDGYEIKDGKLIKSETKTPEMGQYGANTTYSKEELEYELGALEWERDKINKQMKELRTKLIKLNNELLKGDK